MEPFLLFSIGNQRMSTSTNTVIGKSPSWNDSFDFIIFGDQVKIHVLLGDKVAVDPSSNDKQIFADGHVDLTRYLGVTGCGLVKWVSFVHLERDGEIIGKINCRFEFEQRDLTDEEFSKKEMEGLLHEHDYFYEQWEEHMKSCGHEHKFDWKEIRGDHQDHEHENHHSSLPLHTGLLKVSPMRAK